MKVAPEPTVADTLLPHGVALYYDFAGAIDNIYASLIAWLVLARDFGRVRLWTDRAEFEVKDGGLCGLRKVGRPGGFAHVDVYFDTATPTVQQELFVSFVEEHMRQHGVEITEHVALTCACGHKFEEETLRQRIARGEKDVLCPVCETRHNVAEGAAESRQRNPAIAKQTWALKTAIAKRRQKSTELVRGLSRGACLDGGALAPAPARTPRRSRVAVCVGVEAGPVRALRASSRPSSRSFRCAFRIPATSETWSSCVHRLSHTENQLQISQCATGSGYGTAASTDADRGFAISASKFRRTSRKYARNSSKR
jgi:hypothetical protein